MSTDHSLHAKQLNLTNKNAQTKQNTPCDSFEFESNQNYTNKCVENDDEQETNSLEEELRYMLEEITVMREKGVKLIRNVDKISQDLSQLHQQITCKKDGTKVLGTCPEKKPDAKPKRPHSWEGKRPIKEVEEIRNENQLLTHILNETDTLLNRKVFCENDYPEAYLQKLMEFLQPDKGCSLHDYIRKIQKLKESVLILMSQKGCMLNSDDKAPNLIPIDVMKPVENGIVQLQNAKCVEAERAVKLLLALIGSIKITELVMQRTDCGISKPSFALLTGMLLRLMALSPSVRDVLRETLTQVRNVAYKESCE